MAGESSSSAVGTTTASPETEEKTTVTVGWSGKEYIVRVCRDDTVGELKRRICEVTKVMPERQKFLYPNFGSNLSDDSIVLSQLSLKSSLRMTMISTVEDDIFVDQVTMNDFGLEQDAAVDIKDNNKQNLQWCVEQYEVMADSDSTHKRNGNRSCSLYNSGYSTCNETVSPGVFEKEINELQQERNKLLTKVKELTENLEDEKVISKGLTSDVAVANKSIEFWKQEWQKECELRVGVMNSLQSSIEDRRTMLETLRNGFQGLRANFQAYRDTVHELINHLSQQVAQHEVVEEQPMEVDPEAAEHPMEEDFGDGEVVDP